jgi:hypothetical protein
MTPSQRIIIDAGRALRERVLSISDDLKFYHFRREMFGRHRISVVDMGRIAGIAERHMIGRDKAATAAAIRSQGLIPPSELVANGAAYTGKALTIAEHGDPDAPKDLDAWWLANCPLQYRADLLAEYIDNMANLDPATWAFRRFLGRDPQAVGMNHYNAQIAKGRPVWEIVREIELSDEARAR